MLNVHLSFPEIQTAAWVGVRRRVYALKKDYAHAQGGKMGLMDWGYDISGCLSEMAYAKWQNVYWPGSVGEIDKPDFGPVEIKSSWYDEAHLIVQQHQSEDRVYVLATPPDGDGYDKRGGFVCFRGWISGEEAKTFPLRNADPMRFKSGSHWVPMDALQPMDTFVAEVPT